MQLQSSSPAMKISRLFDKLAAGRRFYSDKPIILLTLSGQATRSLLILSLNFPPSRSAYDLLLPAIFRLPIRAPA